MRVVYFASGAFAIPSLRWLQNSPHEIALVVTQPDRPAGRGKKDTPTPIAAHAEGHGLPLERCGDVNTPQYVQRLLTLRADLGIAVAFGQKILAPARAAFAAGCINLHASLLPRWRGAAPINAAILAGDAQTGVTAFRLVDRMDAGPILVQRFTAIGLTETAGELHDRLAGIACDALDAALKLLEADPHASGQPQDESKATRAGKLTKADGLLSFAESAEQIARRCRALWPWPGARCRYQRADGHTEDITIAGATALPVDTESPPGTITPVLTVVAAAGTIEIHSLQPAGKRLMSWQEFTNGRRVQPGDCLVSIPPS